MRVPCAEGGGFEEEPYIVGAPAGSRGNHSRVGHNHVERVNLRSSVLEHGGEDGVAREVLERVLHSLLDVYLASVIGVRGFSVRAHKLRIYSEHQSDIV